MARRQSTRNTKNSTKKSLSIVEDEDAKEKVTKTPKKPAKVTKKKSVGNSGTSKDNNNGLRLATKPDKLTRQDVTCPICWSILFKPTTLPCNHSLCEGCFRKHVEETSLCCPCCRFRISVWSRRALKENKLLDEELWRRIQLEFPRLVEARLTGIDSQNILDDDDDNCNLDDQEEIALSPSLLNEHGHSKAFDGTIVENPGEIRMELQQMMEQHQKDLETERHREETASVGLIKQLQEEESIHDQINRNKLEQDFLMAQKLQQEFKDEQQQQHSSLLQTKKTPRRNLMEDWINANSPDICSLPANRNSASNKKIPSSQTPKTKGFSKKRNSSVRRTSSTATVTSLNVSRASQDVMSKFLSSSQSQNQITDNSPNCTINDDNQPCCSRSVMKHDIRFSAFSPTKVSKGLTVFVPSDTLTMPVSSEIETGVENYNVLKSVDEPLTASTKTPDSIKSEVDRHFRPIKVAPKTPPRRRPDGTFLPEPKLFRSTPMRPLTTSSMKPTSGAIIEKRISNDSGNASDDSRSPDPAGISPTSSLKSSDVSCPASTSCADRGCISEDYRVTPESSGTPNETYKKRANVDEQKSTESPQNKKIKIEPEQDVGHESGSSSRFGSVHMGVVKIEPGSPIQYKRSPFKIDLACSQGIITIDDEDEEYLELETEALKNYRLKAEQEAADRAFAESLQRNFNRGWSSPKQLRRSTRRTQEKNSLQKWLQVKQEKE